jgi:quercetin dioxygenase-like cupin family protein
MARAGQVIGHPVTGETIKFLETSEDTGGKLLRFELSIAPHGFVAAAHVHPGQQERFEVVSGRITVKQGRAERVVGPGTVVEVPAGTAHAWGNDSEETAVVDVQFRPALDTEAFFESFFGLANDEKVSTKSGMPQGLQLMALAHEFRQEMAAPPPAGRAVALVAALLAPVARMRGYRGRYEQTGAAKIKPRDS